MERDKTDKKINECIGFGMMPFSWNYIAPQNLINLLNFGPSSIVYMLLKSKVIRKSYESSRSL